MDGFGIIVFAAIILLSIFNDNKKRPRKQSGEPPRPFDPFGPDGPFGPGRPTGMPETPPTSAPASRPATARTPQKRPATTQPAGSGRRADATPTTAQTTQNTPYSGTGRPRRPSEAKTPGEAVEAILRANLAAKQAAAAGRDPETAAVAAAPAQPERSPEAEAAAETQTPAFDLRQAVIYSEILRPKFTDYE